MGDAGGVGQRRAVLYLGAGVAVVAAYASWRVARWADELLLARAARIHAARKQRAAWWAALLFRAKLAAAGCVAVGALLAVRQLSSPARAGMKQVVSADAGRSTAVTVAY